MNSAKPWVSIIIPMYNSDECISKCLESIIMQSFRNFEVILVDDGSIDHTEDICRDYEKKDSRIKYFRKENGGSFRARSFGIKRASGMNILFCDADDYYTNKKCLETLYHYKENTKCELIQFGYYKKYKYVKKHELNLPQELYIDRNTFVTRDYPKLLCSFWDESRLNTTVWNKLYDQRLFYAYPNEENIEKMFFGDDVIMNLLILETCQSAGYLPDPLYVYNAKSGLTNKWRRETMRDVDIVKKYQLQYLEKWAEGSAEDREKVRSILFSETACWFLDFVRRGLPFIDHEEMAQLIESVLKYPTFMQTREYYLNESQSDWLAHELMRKADPELYIKEAEKLSENEPVKEKIKQVIRKYI